MKNQMLRRRENELRNMVENLPELSEEQVSVSKTLESRNVFLTGSPGCGKSVTLMSVIRDLLYKNLHPERDFFVCSSTGVSSYAIGGVTFHKAFSLPIQDDISLEDAYENVDTFKRKTFNCLRFLIGDEISMLPARLLDMIDYFLRMARHSDQSFGGVRVLFVGDFFQLPPVNTYGIIEVNKYAFLSNVWRKANFVNVNLLTPFRQKDASFVSLISRLRTATHTPQDISELKKRCNVELEKNEYGIKPTCLFTHKAMVIKTNQIFLDAIEKPSFEFRAIDKCDESYYKQQLDQACPSPTELFLKEGAQVMVTKNIYDMCGKLVLTNGTKGKIQSIEVEDTEATDLLPFIQDVLRHRLIDGKIKIQSVVGIFENGVQYKFYENQETWVIKRKKEVKAFRCQIPLMLAWAVTVHKSQGATLHQGIISIDKSFCAGQAMVAISRFRRLEDISILGNVNPETITADDRVIEFYRSL